MTLDAHEIICKLKEAAAAEGRTPTRREFTKIVSEARYLNVFGSYNALVVAAGLEPNHQTKKLRLTNEIFEIDISKHLAEYKPEEIIPRVPYPTIAVLGDMHEPFSHEKLKADFISFVEKHKPQYVIQVGDSIDAYAHSKFPRSLNVFTPKEEEERARKNLEEFWAAVGKASPKSKRVGLLGNHCLRALKRVLEAVPSIEHWAQKYLQDLMSFDGVHMILDSTQEFLIEDIAFLHGYRSKLGDHRDYMLMNAVCGHIHLGGVSYRHLKGKTLWELNAGLAGDPFSKGLSYRNQKMTNWTLGWGYIDAYGPRFIPW